METLIKVRSVQRRLFIKAVNELEGFINQAAQADKWMITAAWKVLADQQTSIQKLNEEIKNSIIADPDFDEESYEKELLEQAEYCMRWLVVNEKYKTAFSVHSEHSYTEKELEEKISVPNLEKVVVAGTLKQELATASCLASVSKVGMMNPAQDGLAPPGDAPSYQQPLYLQEPHTSITTHGAGAPAGNYILQKQPGGQHRLVMMQPTQVLSGSPTPNTATQPPGQVYGSPQRASPPDTTCDDSDDSVPSHHSQMGRSRVRIMGVKRISPEAMVIGINRGKMRKKPKIQKKKKKRKKRRRRIYF